MPVGEEVTSGRLKIHRTLQRCADQSPSKRSTRAKLKVRVPSAHQAQSNPEVRTVFARRTDEELCRLRTTESLTRFHRRPQAPENCPSPPLRREHLADIWRGSPSF